MSKLDKSRLVSMASGALIALAGFALVLWGAAWITPWFLRHADSQWFHALFPISTVFTAIIVLAIVVRQRRSKLVRRG